MYFILHKVKLEYRPKHNQTQPQTQTQTQTQTQIQAKPKNNYIELDTPPNNSLNTQESTPQGLAPLKENFVWVQEEPEPLDLVKFQNKLLRDTVRINRERRGAYGDQEDIVLTPSNTCESAGTSERIRTPSGVEIMDNKSCGGCQNKKLNDRRKVKKISQNAVMPNPPNGQIGGRFPSKFEVLQIIQKFNVKPNYRWNIMNLPVTTKFITSRDADYTNVYEKKIRQNINSWNDILEDKYMLYDRDIRSLEMKPLLVMETQNEFVVKVNVNIKYLDEIIPLELTYYGQIEKSDDMFDAYTLYHLQLIEMHLIKSIDVVPRPVKDMEFKYAEYANLTDMPTLEEQLKYVEKMNNIRKNEGARDYGKKQVRAN
jgi:hypothetical protein